MHTYVVRRLLALVPTLFFASLIVFVTVRLIPGDVIDLMLSQNDISAGKLSRDQLIAALGLDKPMWEQYLPLGRRDPVPRRFRHARCGRARRSASCWRRGCR